MTRPLDQIIAEWQQARNTAARDAISATDARYALEAGLPVLSALHTLEMNLERANPYVSAVEVLAEVRRITHLACGEAVRRTELAGRRLEIPGLPFVPAMPLIEQLAAEEAPPDPPLTALQQIVADALEARRAEKQQP